MKIDLTSKLTNLLIRSKPEQNSVIYRGLKKYVEAHKGYNHITIPHEVIETIIQKAQHNPSQSPTSSVTRRTEKILFAIEDVLKSDDYVEFLSTALPENYMDDIKKKKNNRVTVEMISRYLQSQRLLKTSGKTNTRQSLYNYVHKNSNEFIEVLTAKEKMNEWTLTRELKMFEQYV